MVPYLVAQKVGLWDTSTAAWSAWQMVDCLGYWPVEKWAAMRVAMKGFRSVSQLVALMAAQTAAWMAVLREYLKAAWSVVVKVVELELSKVDSLEQ